MFAKVKTPLIRSYWLFRCWWWEYFSNQKAFRQLRQQSWNMKLLISLYG